MKQTVMLTFIGALLATPASFSHSGTYRCTEMSCGTPNYSQIQRKQNAARIRAMQQHQRTCNYIKSTGRAVMWTGC